MKTPHYSDEMADAIFETLGSEKMGDALDALPEINDQLSCLTDANETIGESLAEISESLKRIAHLLDVIIYEPLGGDCTLMVDVSGAVGVKDID